MYLRWKLVRPSARPDGTVARNPETGRAWRVWALQLVESSRADGKVRQRVVKHLGAVSEQAIASGTPGEQINARYRALLMVKKGLTAALGTDALEAHAPYWPAFEARIPVPTAEELAYSRAKELADAREFAWEYATARGAQAPRPITDVPPVPTPQPLHLPLLGAADLAPRTRARKAPVPGSERKPVRRSPRNAALLHTIWWLHSVCGLDYPDIVHALYHGYPDVPIIPAEHERWIGYILLVLSFAQTEEEARRNLFGASKNV